MFCNLSSDDWKPSFHLAMHSGCGKVREESPPLIGQNIWVCLVCGCLFCDTLHSHLLLCLFSRTLQLLGYAWCDRPHCEICASGCVVCLICRTLASVLFCYGKRLLHLWICFAISISFDTVPGFVLLNSLVRSEQQRLDAKASAARSSETSSAEFFYYTPPLYIWVQRFTLFLHTWFDFFNWWWSFVCSPEISCELIFQLALASDGIIG
jgi:hypothetical protein